MTTEWLKQLHKAVDLVVEVLDRHGFWDQENYEPIMIAFIVPFLSFNPWQLRSSPKMFAVTR